MSAKTFSGWGGGEGGKLLKKLIYLESCVVSVNQQTVTAACYFLLANISQSKSCL